MQASKNKNTRHFDEEFEDSEMVASVMGYDINDGTPGQAVQLIKVPQYGDIQINQSALDIIANCDMPVGFCCLAGKYRTGKSFLLNKLLQLEGTGFRVDPTTKACTEGIWMWTKPAINQRQGNYIFFLDTQGMASLNKDSDSDAKIFTLANLLSSYFVYNSVGSIDEKSIAQLNLVTQLSKNIILQQHSDLRTNQQNLYRYMPKFMWILRDFTLQLADESGKRITPAEYLQSSLFDQNPAIRSNQSTKKIRRALTKYYKDRDCITLVRPAHQQQALQHLNQLPNHALRRQFIQGVNKLRQRILTKTGPKTYEQEPLYGSMIASMIESYVYSMNHGGIPSIKSAWDNINEDQGLNAYDLALQKFNDLYQQNFQQDEPKGEEIHHLLRVMSEASLDQFHHNISQPNDAYQTKLKDFLNEKQQNILQINKQLIKHKNIEILQSSMAPVLQGIQSGYYSNNVNQLNKDVKLATQKYNKQAKGETKGELLSQFLTDLNPVILDIQQKAQQQKNSTSGMKPYQKEQYETKIRNLQKRLQSVNNQALANKNALQTKYSGNKKPTAKPVKNKNVDPNKAGCCGTKGKCSIM